MKKRMRIAAIDVGTTKVCTIAAEIDDSGRLQVDGVGIVPSAGIHKGLVVNINEAKEAIRDSVRQTEQTCNYKIESAYVGVTGRHITSSNNKGVVAITRHDRLVRSDDLKRVLQSAQSLKVPEDRRVLHIIPRSYAVDGQVSVKNPVGMHGFRLDVETHVVTASASSVQNLVKCIRGVGVDIEDLVLEPLASGEAVLSEDETDIGAILADIGGGTTDIAVFREGSIYHTSVLPVAGYQITKDISIGLGLPFEVAEEMKKKHGSLLPSVYEGQTEANTPAPHDGHGQSYQDLCDIIRARMEEVLRLILLEMPSSEYEVLAPSGLVLTGGCANLPGITQFAHEVLRLPVRIGTPGNMDGIADTLSDPAYATSVGLVVWGARNQTGWHETAQPSSSLLRRTVTHFRNLFR